MDCVVYKSVRREEYYLFVPADEGLERVPAPLKEHLGELARVMDLSLTPERRLARQDAGRVMAALAQDGYYLQTPPPRIV
ncbi:YcgL domain-containing protein [Ectothiorhodospiraceae bacterium 2226]|nr:YcgL domain-containing protein [Ectothiorhodospiraceae bacterium 2226]